MSWVDLLIGGCTGGFAVLLGARVSGREAAKKTANLSETLACYKRANRYHELALKLRREDLRIADECKVTARAERDVAMAELADLQASISEHIQIGLQVALDCEAKATTKQEQAIDERDYALDRLMVVMEERDEARAMMNRIRTALAHYSGREDDSVANDHSGDLTPSGDVYMKVMSEAMRQHWPPQRAAVPCGETAPGPCAGHHSEPDVCQGCDRRSEFEHCGPQATMESE